MKKSPVGAGAESVPARREYRYASMRTDEGTNINRSMAVVRLGDAGRLGWWRSHSVDETAEYVLGNAFPSTWMPSGVELAMESARVRHEQLLERSSQVHLFSDYLPFHRQLRDWLIERKLERDFMPIEWIRSASVDELKAILPDPTIGERRASGLYLGTLQRSRLGDDAAVAEVLDVLLAGYASLDEEFVAPYVDLVD